jgi:hypothetical protein
MGLVLSGISAIFSDVMTRPRSNTSIDAKLIQKINRSARGSVFTPTDFLALGKRAAIDQALSRMTKAGRLRRVGRGLYDRPRVSPILGEPLSPNLEKAAKAIGRRSGLRIMPSVAAAANLLGFTTQVPARTSYQTDGRGAPVTLINGKRIYFSKRSPRQMALADRVSGIIVSGLCSFRRNPDALTPEILGRLGKSLRPAQRKQLLDDLHLIPEWMHFHIRFIASGRTEGV